MICEIHSVMDCQICPISEHLHIFFYSQKKNGFEWLSNFAQYPIVVEDIYYPTSEHYYQAKKTFNPVEQEMIRRCRSPLEAKLAGRHVRLRSDWEEVKQDVMLKALRVKFGSYPELQAKLQDTGNAILHEDSAQDMYWGYAGGLGKDMLGEVLMQVRNEFKLFLSRNRKVGIEKRI